MPATTLFVQHQHQRSHTLHDDSDEEVEQLHYLSREKALYIISESSHVHSVNPLSCERTACASPSLPISIGTPLRTATSRRAPRPLMATISYSHDAQNIYGAPPGSPPDLTNSKSSKSSSFHSSTLSADFMGPSDLSHFEDINLDEASAPKPVPSNVRSLAHSQSHHSFRDLTGTAKPRYPSLRNQVNHAVQRQPGQLAAPGKQLRRGITSPSTSSLTGLGLGVPKRTSRSVSPSDTRQIPASPRTLSRKSSRNDVLPSPGLNPRRQSWQDTKRKTVKEREAECDDEDDDLPEDAIIWNVPISPRPTMDRSPASSAGSPPSASPNLSAVEQSSAKTSPAPSTYQYTPRSQSPNTSARGDSPPDLSRQRTNTWAQTYTNLDEDARKLTEALEEFQTDVERKQEVQRQQPGLTRSASQSQLEPKSKKPALPPVRKSDPLIDPFQPSAEKQKYLSRTRPSWLPPKNPKEEKKHLKEYQRMLARIEEAERAEALRAQEEALAREKATRIKAEYWSTLLLPNWATEMTNPELRATHRKMWWNGIPPRLRGQVWQKAIGNELSVTETTYNIALDKAHKAIDQHGLDALEGRYAHIKQSTATVFPDLRMFAPEQPLHADLVHVCLAYATYRPDITHHSTAIPPIAALLLLNLPAPEAFITLSNLLNRALPLSFLLHDSAATLAAYGTTLAALQRKFPVLAARLAELRVEPAEYLFEMLSSLFTSRLDVESAARVLDVYVVEGDKIPTRVAVALMGGFEGKCLAAKDAEEIVQVMREALVEGGSDEFMARVYEAGKSERSEK